MPTRIQIRRDPADRWEAANQVLGIGEPGYDTTNRVLKVGDGVTRWLDLAAIDERAYDEAAGKYELPSDGIPSTDLSLPLQQSLIPFTGITDLTGVAAFGFGNSWVASATGGITQYVDRALTKLNAASYTNLANSGFRMQDTATDAFASTTKQWPQGRKGVVIVGDLLNNAADADTLPNRAAALEGMRSLVALLLSTHRVEQSTNAFTLSTSPAWSNPNIARAFASGGTLSFGRASGLYADFQVPGGTSYLLAQGVDGTTLAGTSVTVTKDGATVATKNLNQVAVKTSYHADATTPVVIRLPNMQPGTARVTATDANYLFLDGLLPQYSSGGPLVFLVKPLQVTSSGYQKPDLMTYLRTVPDLVQAEFGDRVVVVDPAPNWDPSTMLLVDGLHPNEAGAAYLGNFLADAIRTEVTTRAYRALQTAIGLR